MAAKLGGADCPVLGRISKKQTSREFAIESERQSFRDATWPVS